MKHYFVQKGGMVFNYKSKEDFKILYDEIFKKDVYHVNLNSDSPVIIDCGSNIGVSVLYFKKKYPNANIIAFEPFEDCYNLLKKNISDNKLTNVKAYKLALGDKVRKVDFFYEKSGSTLGNTADHRWGERVGYEKACVQQVKLSDYIKNKQIDLLKLDVEGKERAVLNDIKKYLKNISSVVMEFHELSGAKKNNTELKWIIKLLIKNGFIVNVREENLVELLKNNNKFQEWLKKYSPKIHIISATKNNSNIKKIEELNRLAWEKNADRFIASEALPSLFPYDNGEYIHLLGDVNSKKILELGCGSGHSMKYLIERGASFVEGVDFSKKQIQIAKKINKEALKKNLAKLRCESLDVDLKTKNFDIVLSVYGFGWSQNPKESLRYIYKYLKPGGFFLWSWDHPLCSITDIKNGRLVISEKYHGLKLLKLDLFGEPVFQYVGSISWWMSAIKETGFIIDSFIEVGYSEINNMGLGDHGGFYGDKKISKIPSSMIWLLRKPKV